MTLSVDHSLLGEQECTEPVSYSGCGPAGKGGTYALATAGDLGALGGASKHIGDVDVEERPVTPSRKLS